MTEAQAIEQNPQRLMRSIIQRIATGPELSKDISQEEARAGIKAILEGYINPEQMAIFLIALRMKRETQEENLGVLDGIKDLTITATAPVDDVVDISDPYNGYNRSLPASPFLPALLSACGIPAYSQGVETASPKFGVTHRKILRAAGVPVDLSPQAAADRLGSNGPGWAYVDQSQFCKPLNDLLEFRSRMVKRSVITTVETVLGPIRGRQNSHLVTGYVHKPYPPIYAMLARHSGLSSALLVRGVEGGVIPSLRQTGQFYSYWGADEERSLSTEPEDLGIAQEVRATPIPESIPMPEEDPNAEIALQLDTEAVAQASLEAGLAALEGKPGSTRDALIYAAAAVLWHLRRYDNLKDAAVMARAALDDGSALARFNAGRS